MGYKWVGDGVKMVGEIKNCSFPSITSIQVFFNVFEKREDGDARGIL